MRFLVLAFFWTSAAFAQGGMMPGPGTTHSVGSYSTWNNTVNSQPTYGITYSNGNNTASFNTSGTEYGSIGTVFNSSGKLYIEVSVTFSGSPCCLQIGFTNTTGAPTNGNGGASGLAANYILWDVAGTNFTIGSAAANTTTALSAGTTVVAFVLDFSTNLLWVKNGCAGNWNNNATNDPVAEVGGWSFVTGGTFNGGALAVLASDNYDTSGVVTINTGGSAFSCTQPTGTTAWH